MRIFALLAALASLPACAADSGSGDSARFTDLDDHRMLWNRPNRTEYSFVWQQGCFCPDEVSRPMRVNVKNDQVVSAAYVSDGQPVAATAKNTILTINGVFDLIQHGIEANFDLLRVEYDPSGYPAHVAIDVYTGAADDERDLRISDVGAIAP